MMAGAAAPAEEAPTEFNVILTGFGEKKIQVIKEVRAITSLGLKEAKDLVEGVPSPVKEGVPKEEADKERSLSSPNLKGTGSPKKYDEFQKLRASPVSGST